jgi:hypothetical protein
MSIKNPKLSKYKKYLTLLFLKDPKIYKTRKHLKIEFKKHLKYFIFLDKKFKLKYLFKKYYKRMLRKKRNKRL